MLRLKSFVLYVRVIEPVPGPTPHNGMVFPSCSMVTVNVAILPTARNVTGAFALESQPHPEEPSGGGASIQSNAVHEVRLSGARIPSMAPANAADPKPPASNETATTEWETLPPLSARWLDRGYLCARIARAAARKCCTAPAWPLTQRIHVDPDCLFALSASRTDHVANDELSTPRAFDRIVNKPRDRG